MADDGVERRDPLAMLAQVLRNIETIFHPSPNHSRDASVTFMIFASTSHKFFTDLLTGSLSDPTMLSDLGDRPETTILIANKIDELEAAGYLTHEMVPDEARAVFKKVREQRRAAGRAAISAMNDMLIEYCGTTSQVQRAAIARSLHGLISESSDVINESITPKDARFIYAATQKAPELVTDVFDKPQAADTWSRVELFATGKAPPTAGPVDPLQGLGLGGFNAGR